MANLDASMTNDALRMALAARVKKDGSSSLGESRGEDSHMNRMAAAALQQHQQQTKTREKRRTPRGSKVILSL